MMKITPLAFTFTLLFFLSTIVTAQMSQEQLTKKIADTATNIEAKKAEGAKILGPQAKNPNAAGRLLTKKQATEIRRPVLQLGERAYGPAFKNWKPVFSYKKVYRRPSSKKRVMGPRYKNRTAKTGN